MSKSYTIVQFLESVSEGFEFTRRTWPLHSTVVDTFSITWDVEKLITELEKCLADHDKAHTEADADAQFGEKGQVHVITLAMTDSVISLHIDLVRLLEKGDVKFEKPQYVRSGFIPHATVQSHARLRRGDKVQFDSLSIIDMRPDHAVTHRKVIKTLPVGSKYVR